MKALSKQVVIVANSNDVPQAVVVGRYPIGLGSSTTRTRRFIEEGAPLKFTHPKEGSHMAANGIMFITNSRRPNAAKLFLHWFYTKEGQSIYAPKTRVISTRKDIPQEYLHKNERYIEGQPFMMPYAEDQQGRRPRELMQLGRKIFGLPGKKK